MKECSLDWTFLVGAAGLFCFLWEGGVGFFQIDETRFS